MRATLALALLLGTAAGLQVTPPVMHRAAMPMRSCVPLMQKKDGPEPAVGISSVLGGGKSSDDVEKSTTAEIGSLAAFVIVLAALAFGAVNPDFVEDIAKSQSKCVQGKIIKGVKQQCNPDGTYIR